MMTTAEDALELFGEAGRQLCATAKYLVAIPECGPERFETRAKHEAYLVARRQLLARLYLPGEFPEVDVAAAESFAHLVESERIEFGGCL